MITLAEQKCWLSLPADVENNAPTAGVPENAFPFRDGAPVIEGREAIRRHLAEGFGRAPVSFSGVKHAIVHHTEDPHTVIVECTFDGTLTSTGAVFEPSYVEVLTERDGLIGAVRDYENLAYRAAREVSHR